MKKTLINKLILIVLPILIFIIGITISWIIVHSRTQIPLKTSVKQKSYPVKVIKVTPDKHEMVVTAWGIVKPALQVDISPQVSGIVTRVSPDLLPGGLFQKDQFILKVDEAKYALTVQQKKSELKIAQDELLLEYGKQRIAEQEFNIINQQLTKDEESLVLRKPQLDTANANIEVAQIALENALLELEQTIITSPFDAVVLEDNVDVGAQVASQTTLAKLVGTDYYWVEVVLPLNELKWLKMNNHTYTGSVKLYYPSVWENGKIRYGKVIRLLANVTEKGRMARLLVRVDDPLALTHNNKGLPELLLGSYLEAKIQGKTLYKVVQLNKEWVHNGNEVWLFKNDRLYIKHIEIIYENQDTVITASLKNDDQIIISDIGIVADGMPVKIFDKFNLIEGSH